jgi:hypothetical protein
MAFLTPIFLLGALAIGLPVVFHLIRRTTRERTVFSSLMFLLSTPPRLTRRSRLEHILLLLFRCLALCLLAAGFARPFIRKAMSDDRSSANARRIVILVDTSASMRRADLWTEARERAAAVLRKASPADQVALFTFDRHVTPLVTFEQWAAAPVHERAAIAASKLAATSPGWSATQLGRALVRAAETLADTAGKAASGPGQIVLISDLQEGSHLESLQGYEWPRGVEISVEVLKARRPNNASLQLVTDSNDPDPKSSAGVRVRVSSVAGSARDQFQVGWSGANGSGFVGKPANAYVPPGQSRIVTLPIPSAASTVDRIRLQGDDEDFDNTVFMVPPETNRSTVLYLGHDAADDPKRPLYFLLRAFRDTRRQAVKVLAPLTQPMGPGSRETVSTAQLAANAQASTLFILTDALPPETARLVQAQLAAGKTALAALTTLAMAPTVAALLGLDHVVVEEAQPSRYAMLAEIDFRHPLFAPFADPRFSDFTKIHFWHFRKLDSATVPGAHVAARFDAGDPALLDIPVSKGRLLILASSWQPDDSQLAVSSKFVPMLYALLGESAGLATSPADYHVGDVLPLSHRMGESAALSISSSPDPTPFSIRLPDGSQMITGAGETNFSHTTLPGIYTVTSAQPLQRFAVNLDPAESRTAPLSVEDLERLGAPVSRQPQVVAQEAERKIRLQNAELEARQKLWRWFIAATLAVLLFETWLAGRTARRLTALAVPIDSVDSR